jgi:regulator of protease activity HflC (stomatin/prohibitin superfamily)
MWRKRNEALLWMLAFVAATGICVLLDSPDAVIPLWILWALILAVRFSVNIVPEYVRLVVFRMGRCIGAKGPGLVLVIPFIDKPRPIDTREQYREVPHESCITKDNAKIDVDFLFYWRIHEPALSVTRVQNLQDSLGGLATGLLRAVIGDISLDDALAEREHINLQLREKIDEVTERWGVEVTTVEIREIVMPPDTQEIMTRQMAAERTKRAMVLEAQGYKEAQMLKAEGDAAALEMLHTAASQIDSNTMSLKYLDMLRQLGEGAATKFVLPLEFTNLLRTLSETLGGGRPEINVTPDAPTAPLSTTGAQQPANGHATHGNGHKNTPRVA